MTDEERRELIKKVIGVFNFDWYFSYVKNDETTIEACRSFIMSFFYRILSTHLIEKEFSFYKCIPENFNYELCDLIDDTIIDLKHYLSYIERYRDKNSVYYELKKLNDDYLDIHKIPEFNSKKYISEKIAHIGKILFKLEKIINKSMPSELTVDFNASKDLYGNKRVVLGNKMGSSHNLDLFWEYITPVATDEAILAMFERKIFEQNIKKVRLQVLNSIEELEIFLELDCLDVFLSKEEINKLKGFLKYFKEFNERQCELFGIEELGYGETRRYKHW